MFEQTQWVWMDGEIVPWNDATVHVSSHALHYGTGVFEGIRCYDTEDGPAIFRADAHLKRFCASAEVYGLRIPYSAGKAHGGGVRSHSGEWLPELLHPANLLLRQ